MCVVSFAGQGQSVVSGLHSVPEGLVGALGTRRFEELVRVLSTRRFVIESEVAG